MQQIGWLKQGLSFFPNLMLKRDLSCPLSGLSLALRITGEGLVNVLQRVLNRTRKSGKPDLRLPG